MKDLSSKQEGSFLDQLLLKDSAADYERANIQRRYRLEVHKEALNYYIFYFV